MAECVFESFTRRQFLKLGGFSGLSLLPAWLLGRPHTNPQAKSIILLWMDGGPSHLDTFDPKPDAPTNIRGEFGVIPTSVPGLRISDRLPRMARVMRRCALVRTLSHHEGSHERACRAMLTGRSSDPDGIPPSIGSIVARESVSGVRSSVFGVGPDSSIPPYVAIGGAGLGFGFGQAGSLHSCCSPAIMTNESVGRLVEREPESMKRLYGPTTFGQRCLLARQLVEAGVRFITVSSSGWDTHCDNAISLDRWLLPPLDQGMSALIEDLHQRGLLSETLVVWMGEFGRSPEMNALSGRDHWPRTGCVLFAGAGVPAGSVVGRTDSRGAEPLERPIAPQDIAATILAKLGIGTARAIPGHSIAELGA